MGTFPRSLFVASIVALLGVGCGDDAGPPETDAEVALGVCEPIREYRNEIASTLAAAQDRVRDDGETPRGAFLPAFRDLAAATGELGEEFDALELEAGGAARRALADQLREGVLSAAEVFDALVAEFEAIGDPDPESVNSRLATAFVRTEKPVEEVKPEVRNDLGDEALERAFADEPQCSFAIVR